MPEAIFPRQQNITDIVELAYSIHVYILYIYILHIPIFVCLTTSPLSAKVGNSFEICRLLEEDAALLLGTVYFSQSGL